MVFKKVLLATLSQRYIFGLFSPPYPAMKYSRDGIYYQRLLKCMTFSASIFRCCPQGITVVMPLLIFVERVSVSIQSFPSSSTYHRNFCSSTSEVMKINHSAKWHDGNKKNNISQVDESGGGSRKHQI